MERATDNASASSAQHALIVDDDEFLREMLQEMLSRLGVGRIEEAADGRLALERLRKTQLLAPDLLLCDLAMPGMDGIEFLRHLAQQGYTGGVVLLSGTNARILYAAEQLGRAHGLPMLGVLEKPVSLSALREVLGQFASLRPAPAAPPSAPLRLSAEEVRAGLIAGRVVAHFQPKIEVATRRMSGVECLARWQCPERGTLPPSVFIDVAEQNGLIGQVTETVFRLAARQAGEWRRQGLALKVNVNLSMDDVGRLDLPEVLCAWAAEGGVGSEEMVLELTESRLMGDMRANLDIITRLRLKNFGLSIDDFGTGYSTLDKLRNLPFTELKIDRAFVAGAARDKTARAILESSVHLGKSLGLRLVAEGVETQEDWDLIAALGVDEAQGYFLSRPMRGPEIAGWKRAWEGESTVDLSKLHDIVGADAAAHRRILESFSIRRARASSHCAQRIAAAIRRRWRAWATSCVPAPARSAPPRWPIFAKPWKVPAVVAISNAAAICSTNSAGISSRWRR